jgi:hypothetical protein
LGLRLATYGSALGVRRDEICNLVEIADRKLVLLDKFRSSFVWILRKVVRQFQWWFSVLNVYIKDEIVVGAIVRDLYRC